MHTSLAPWKGIITALAVALVISACSSATDGGAVAGGGGESTIGFASPTSGATVSIPFSVELDSSVPLGEPDTGNHHAHLYFDAAPGSADYDIVYGTTWQVTRSLAPGEHTITVALANPDHSLAGPTQSIKVVVGAAGGGGSQAPVVSPSGGPVY